MNKTITLPLFCPFASDLWDLVMDKPGTRDWGPLSLSLGCQPCLISIFYSNKYSSEQNREIVISLYPLQPSYPELSSFKCPPNLCLRGLEFSEIISGPEDLMSVSSPPVATGNGDDSREPEWYLGWRKCGVSRAAKETESQLRREAKILRNGKAVLSPGTEVGGTSKRRGSSWPGSLMAETGLGETGMKWSKEKDSRSVMPSFT